MPIRVLYVHQDGQLSGSAISLRNILCALENGQTGFKKPVDVIRLLLLEEIHTRPSFGQSLGELD